MLFLHEVVQSVRQRADRRDGDHFALGRARIDNSSLPQHVNQREQRGGFAETPLRRELGNLPVVCWWSVELNILFALFLGAAPATQSCVLSCVTHPSLSCPVGYFFSPPTPHLRVSQCSPSMRYHEGGIDYLFVNKIK